MAGGGGLLGGAGKGAGGAGRARSPQALAIPTIGIGAGADCDGQVLVVDDMLGLFTDFRPKFVKRYAELGQAADEAIAAYAAEVRARRFPGARARASPTTCRGEAVTPILRTVAELRALVRGWKAAGAVVGVVPTMGALHDGHLSLARAARTDCDRVITTIFVNPKQFNNPDDLKKYPRTEEADAALLAHGARWTRSSRRRPEEVYPEGFTTNVSVHGRRRSRWKGCMRPGPFRRRGDGGDQAVRHDAGRPRPISARRTGSSCRWCCGWCAT